MIACDSARSQAYLQAMLANGTVPEEVIFLGEERDDHRIAPPKARNWGGLILPDLSESFSTTCAKAGIRVHKIGDADVNSDEMLQVLKKTNAHLAIYSGVGGQIVHKKILDAGPRFLHMHSGWLPEYRGSTTLYFSILNGEPPGVSAIFLDDKIDTGPILKRQTYSTPPSWMDVDLVYDGAIRANLLCNLVRQYLELGKIVPIATQDPKTGRTYYVVHPVLKHVALLTIGANPNGG